MPYIPIPLPDHVGAETRALFADSINRLLEEFRFLLTVKRPNQGPHGSLHHSLTVLILAAADAASQFLQPGRMGNGERFKAFLEANYPWELDRPEGFTIPQATEYCWRDLRNPMMHRFGVKASHDGLVWKLGRIFTSSDDSLTKLEQLEGQRPFSDPSLGRDPTRVVFWIDSFYWGLRQAMKHAISTPEKGDGVERWIASGDWDHSRRRASP